MDWSVMNLAQATVWIANVTDKREPASVVRMDFMVLHVGILVHRIVKITNATSKLGNVLNAKENVLERTALVMASATRMNVLQTEDVLIVKLDIMERVVHSNAQQAALVHAKEHMERAKLAGRVCMDCFAMNDVQNIAVVTHVIKSLEDARVVRKEDTEKSAYVLANVEKQNVILILVFVTNVLRVIMELFALMHAQLIVIIWDATVTQVNVSSA